MNPLQRSAHRLFDFMDGGRRPYFVHCFKCGYRQPLTTEEHTQGNWDIRELEGLTCPHCRARVQVYHKQWQKTLVLFVIVGLLAWLGWCG